MASIFRASLLRKTGTASRCLVPSPTKAVRPVLAQSMGAQATAFHTTARKNILPPGPQVIEGTVNDPAIVPPHSPTHGSYHWTFERAIALALVPLSVAPFAAGSLNPVMDAVLCGGLLIHSHLGLQNIIIDYVPKRRYRTAHKASMWGLNAATAVVGLAFYEFETNDVGVTEAVRKIWKA